MEVVERGLVGTIELTESWHTKPVNPDKHAHTNEKSLAEVKVHFLPFKHGFGLQILVQESPNPSIHMYSASPFRF